MGRKKKEPDPMDAPPPDDAARTAEILGWLEKLPPMEKAGKPNPDHYRARLMRLSLIAENTFGSGSELPGGFAQVQKAILEEAKHAGLSPRQVYDHRTDADKISDAVEKLIAAPGEALGLLQDEVEGIERAMDSADRLVEQTIEERIERGDIGRIHGTSKEKPPPKSPRLGQWRNLLQRLKRVRFRATTPIPIEGRRFGLTPNKLIALEMAHLLRFMAYVGRTNIADRIDPKKPSTSTFLFGGHHADLAIDLWLAHHKKEIVGAGKLAPAEPDGVLAAMSPGHGKSEIGFFWVTLEVCMNPYSCGIIFHRQAPLAEDILRYIKQNFDRQNIQGRRCMSLFPCELDSYDNDAGKLRLKLDRVLKQPTISAYGINSKVLGTSINWALMDDVVDQEIAQQADTRDHVFNRLNGTVFARLRGTKTTTITLCNLWHYDDPNMRRIKNPGNTRILVRNCGGPSNGFKPLWPEVYNSAFLRRKYEQLRNPQLYAALYECNPLPDEARIIKVLRLYDPKEPDHQRFLRGGVSHLSIDPSATDNARSDKAAWIHATEGTLIQDQRIDDGSSVSNSERQLRILGAEQFLSTQIALVDKSKDYCAANKIDHVHVESAAAFRGFAEMFMGFYGLQVIQHVPAKYSKTQRLKMAAPLIEDGNAAKGLRAVVLFPGARDESGKLVIDPRFQWLANQILDFGVHPDDHAVDALSQLVNYLAANLGVGRGLASQQFAAAAPLLSEYQKKLGELWASGEKKNDADEEARFLNQNWE